jgi:protein-S-isoprenylcysteine O-methyltransferase Ste14
MSTQVTTASRGAHVYPVPPPAYYGAGLVAGALLERLAPLPLGGHRALTVAGAALVVAGATLAVAGVAGVVRHRTTIVPHRSVSALVTSGGYRWSRNPMYAGLAVAYLGVSALIGSWWPLVLWPVVLTAVARFVIRPEERYLNDRFGRQYLDYSARVRRWL